MKDFIQSLPKTETHLHIEGALPYELLRAWKPDTYPDNPYFHAPDFRYPSFPKFDEILLGHALPWFVSAERYYEAAKAIFAKHVAQNVRYVETSFHLPVTGFIGVPGPEIIAAIRAAVPAGLEVRIFTGMARTDYQGPMQAVIDDLGRWEGLAGVDLHGLESLPNEPWTAKVWARLRSEGKVTKAHAGEFGGANRVREAIEELGATRIQHGVRAIEDPAVVALAAERGVTFDVCPLSNVKLCVTPSIAGHPLRALSAAGVRCTISTDDPLVFGNALNDEYAALADEAGFTKAELARLAKNGWEVADVPVATRAAMIAEIDRLAAKSS
ncbi:adenosine deaminase family protein [Rariglobus hedericola]|uniref:Adenosine deaminase family protein n=1 Tax=Rariglobus hedericola TaxID=2597822 RepID=A0A556QMN2_9BACT|nr:adenosine deaminase family protein [Rariglobus hedericola]TSJ77910.1 adenosine deaminase family protein [Rariglobus hedericola]